MCELEPVLCVAEWTSGVLCPRAAPEIPPPLRTAGYREQPKCYLHRNDNVVSKVLHLLADRGYAVLMRCPDGCAHYGGSFGCDCKTGDGQLARPRRSTYCLYEVDAAIVIIQLAVEQLLAMESHLSPQHFRRLADLCSARLILGRLESHLVQHGVVDEVSTQTDNGQRTTSGRVSSFVAARLRLMALVRQHERDLGLDRP